MKKMYGAPKAEKVEFNFSDVVVASNSCDNITPMTEHTVSNDEACLVRPMEYATNGCTTFTDKA